jgi:hypothetical protein
MKILTQLFQVQSPLLGCLVFAGVVVGAGSPNSHGRLPDVLLIPALLVEEALQEHVEGRPLVHGSSPARVETLLNKKTNTIGINYQLQLLLLQYCYFC